MLGVPRSRLKMESERPTGDWTARTIPTRTRTTPAEKRFNETQQATRSSRTPRSAENTTRAPVARHEVAPGILAWLSVPGPQAGPPVRWISPTCSEMLADHPADAGRSTGSSGSMTPRAWPGSPGYLGVDLARLAKLACENIQLKANASFKYERLESFPKTASDASAKKPPKPCSHANRRRRASHPLPSRPSKGRHP